MLKMIINLNTIIYIYIFYNKNEDKYTKIDI